MKKLLKILVVLLIIAGVIAAGAYFWYDSSINNPVNKDAQEVTFEVKSGESAEFIAQRLKNENIISSAEAMLLYLKINELGGNIKAGTFKVSAAKNIKEIVNILSQSPSKETAWIQIKEGIRADEIVDSLQTQLVAENIFLSKEKMMDIITNPDKYEFSATTEEFLNKYKPAGKNLEGFLFPDTHNIDVTITELQLIDLLVGTLRTKLTTSDFTKIEASGYSFYEVLTMASILEREANNSTDFKIVSGILFDRLERGEILGADATLLYYFKDWKHVLKQSELANTSNPYNTRRLTGLPPTPISNPGLATLQAAIEPTDTDYRFYLTGSDGKMYYAKTYAEHQANYKYL